MAQTSHHMHVSAVSFLRGRFHRTVRFIKKICVFNSRNSSTSSARFQEHLAEHPSITQCESPPTGNIETTSDGDVEARIYQGREAKRSEKTGNMAIVNIETVLRAFKRVADIFPPLATAVDEIVACLHIAEVAENYRDDYKSLAIELETMTKTLDAIIGELGYDPEDQEQGLARQISKKQYRGKEFRVFAARRHEAYVAECHCRIKTWLLQLQAQTNFIMMRDTRMNLRITLLQRLFPVECSKYSEVVRRGSNIQDTVIDVPDDLERWISSDDSPKVYWMTGMAGTGKTTIAYSLSKRLDEQGQLGASFFCSKDSSDCSDANRIVPTIASQLAQYSRTFQQSLCQILENDPGVRTLSVERQLATLIFDILRDSNQRNIIKNTTVIVIDALNECRDQTAIKLMVNALLRHSAFLPFKVFVTSQSAPSGQGTPLSAEERSPFLQLRSLSDCSIADRNWLSYTHAHGMSDCQSFLCGSCVQSSQCDINIPLNHATGAHLDQPHSFVEQDVIEHSLMQGAHIGAGNAKRACPGVTTGIRLKLSSQEGLSCLSPIKRTSSPRPSDYLEPLDFGPPTSPNCDAIQSVSLVEKRPFPRCKVFGEYPYFYSDGYNYYSIFSKDPENNTHRNTGINTADKSTKLGSYGTDTWAETVTSTNERSALPRSQLYYSPIVPPEMAETPVHRPSHAISPEWVMRSGDHFRLLTIRLGPGPPIWPLELAIQHTNQTSIASKNLLGVIVSREHIKYVTDKLDGLDITSVHLSAILNIISIGTTSMARGVRRLAGQTGVPRVIQNFLTCFRSLAIGDLEVKLQTPLNDHPTAAIELANCPTSRTPLEFHNFKLVEFTGILQGYKMIPIDTELTSYIQSILSGLLDRSRNARDTAHIHVRIGIPFGTNGSDTTGNVCGLFNKSGNMLSRCSTHDNVPVVKPLVYKLHLEK
ncbi:hypothetical protein B0J17DRAFT_754519 [Rhizoctonia solani]|nr:hypothetical protein B0J17DRAFT_754519 [Rhizoctonia solani]